MKRVYLDQMHWVNLSAARLNQNKGRDFQDALSVAQYAVDAGHASFPLSLMHYLETSNRRDWRTRRDLAETMGKLSLFHTMAQHNTIIDREIERAVQQRFGLQVTPPLQVFGYGSEFIAGRKLPAYTVPEEIARRLPPGEKWRIEQAASALREPWLLSGVPPDTEYRLQERDPRFDPAAPMQTAAEYAVKQEQERDQRIAQGVNKGQKARDHFVNAGLIDNMEVFQRVFAKHSLGVEALNELGPQGMRELIPNIPTLHASIDFQRNRHVASQRPIEASDAGDQLALPPAVVYCDIVITERQHAAGMRRLGFDERYDTVILHDLRDLPAKLVG